MTKAVIPECMARTLPIALPVSLPAGATWRERGRNDDPIAAMPRNRRNAGIGARSRRKPIAHYMSWTVAATVMVAALLWPALWNGFPIVSDDTGGYLARPFEGSLLFGRSAFYGAFLALGIPLDFWPNVVAQSVLVAWLVALTLCTHGFGGRPSLAAATVVGLSALTGLPWFVSQLMPDALVPACVLAMYLLAFRADTMRRGERILLVTIVSASMASHMATLGLAAALLAVFALLRPLAARLAVPCPNLFNPALAVMLGVLLGPLSNLAIAGRFAFTPGAANFEFARLVQSGIAARYLSEHCPDPTIRLCAFRDSLPTTGDTWLWSEDSPLAKLGGTDGFAAEAGRIAWHSLLAYPGHHVTTALISTAEQFSNVGVGYVMAPAHWHARFTLERLAPNSIGSLRESRESKSRLDLSWLGIVHAPIASLAIITLPIFVAMAGRRRIPAAAAALLATMLAALLLNAAIVGTFANPADRYQNRLAPLALLAAGLAILARRESRRSAKPDAFEIPRDDASGGHFGRHDPSAHGETNWRQAPTSPPLFQ